MKRLMSALGLFLCCGLFCADAARGQDESGPAPSAKVNTARPETAQIVPDLTLQFYFLIGSANGENAKVPAPLDGTVKELKALLPAPKYRLGATLLGRVSGERGKLELQWDEALISGIPETAWQHRPHSLSVQDVSWRTNDLSDNQIRLRSVVFRMDIPTKVGENRTADGILKPLFQGQSSSLQTSLTVREGEPTIVGTLNVGATGETIVLVVVAKRNTPAK